METDRLALFGGKPVRAKPFLVEPLTDGDEEAFVLSAVREKSFSRYIGSASADIERTLRMTSAEAGAVSDYWHFLGGPHVRAFAAEFAAWAGVPYAIPINSATTGLGVALAAAGVGPGDEVILPAISFSASASAVLLFNSIPVFVDVDAETFCIDPARIEAAITPRTRAIMPVHLAGNVADMAAIMDIARRRGLKVIEDAAQAIGAEWRGIKAGAIGDAGVFSFQQSKNITTGEGGVIITRDAELARRARLILNHGEAVFDDRHTADDLDNMVGFNFRLPELCAALGRAQLKKLGRVNAWRTENADLLRGLLVGLPGIDLPPDQRASTNDVRNVPHFFVALHDAAAMGVGRDVFVAALRAEGIPVGTGYVRPMYGNPLFLKRVAYGHHGCPWTCGPEPSARRYEMGMCPTAEALLDERFLWFYHIAYSSGPEDMRDIARAVQKVVDARADLRNADDAEIQRFGGKSQGRLDGRGVAPAQITGRS
jgi:dTDP-4-amino-4,6-dideoxygalactose transaminase